MLGINQCRSRDYLRPDSGGLVASEEECLLQASSSRPEEIQQRALSKVKKEIQRVKDCSRKES